MKLRERSREREGGDGRWMIKIGGRYEEEGGGWNFLVVKLIENFHRNGPLNFDVKNSSEFI